MLVGGHLKRVGTRERSTAILVDAAHLRSDVISSSGVLLGLLLVRLTGRSELDAIAGAGVGVFVARAAWQALRASTQELLDRSLPEEEAVVRRILDAHLPQYLN